MRSQAYFQKGEPAAAKHCARKEIEAEPDLPAAYFCGLAISLKEKDFAATSALLTTVRDKFPRRMPVLKDNPDFAEYVKSPQYSTWANAREAVKVPVS